MDSVGGQAATDGVSTDGSLMCSNGMTTSLTCCGKSVLQMLEQNKAILWCGDSGTTLRGRSLLLLVELYQYYINVADGRFINE